MKEQPPERTAALPTIAIVGRPNVGKSSLFNSILKRRHAIVHFDSGVTRDRVSSTGLFEGRRFRLVDIKSDKFNSVVENILNAITPEDYEAAKKYVANPEEYDFHKILNWK